MKTLRFQIYVFSLLSTGLALAGSDPKSDCSRQLTLLWSAAPKAYYEPDLAPSLSISRDGSVAAIIGRPTDPKVDIFHFNQKNFKQPELVAMKSIVPLDPDGNGLEAVAVSMANEAGVNAIAVSTGNLIEVHRTHSPEIVTLESGIDRATALRFMNGPSRLASTSGNSGVIWDLVSRKPLFHLSGAVPQAKHPTAIRFLEFANNPWLMASASNHQVRVWEPDPTLDSKTSHYTSSRGIEFSNEIEAFAFSGSGDIAVSNAQGDVTKLSRKAPFSYETSWISQNEGNRPAQLFFFKDDEVLAQRFESGEIEFIQSSNGRIRVVIPADAKDKATSMMSVQQGNSLLTGHESGMVRLWSLVPPPSGRAHARLIKQMSGPTAAIRSIQPLPGEFNQSEWVERFVTTAEDGTIHLGSIQKKTSGGF